MQKVWPELQRHSIALFAISYDSVEVLANFAEKYTIEYPLLSDEGSRVIRDLGLYNEHVYEQHAVYNIPPRDEHQGVPYPGVFVLDENGNVTEKRFEQSYRVRDTGVALIEDALGILAPTHGAQREAASDAVRVRVYLDSDTFAWYQQHRLTVELDIDEGYHVYGEPIPEGYVPVSITIDPIEGLEAGKAKWPKPHRFTLEGLDDEFWVFEGKTRGTVPFRFTADPGLGDQVIRGTVGFQACTESFCLPPATIPFELPIAEVALVERPIKR